MKQGADGTNWRNITHIVVHYSATPRGERHTVADITKWHKACGFRTIGYHYVIHLDGVVHVGRSPETAQGAHVKGHNKNTIGICWIGGTEKGAPNTGVDTRTREQTDSLITLINELLERHPGAKVVGHRDIADKPTECPGFDVIPWWASVTGSETRPPPRQPDDPGVPQTPKPSPATRSVGGRLIGALGLVAVGAAAKFLWPKIKKQPAIAGALVAAATIFALVLFGGN